MRRFVPELDSCAAALDAIPHTALELGGTITGEHRVGRLKADWLRSKLDPVAMFVYHSVKAALDPAVTLHPGAVVATEIARRA